MALDVLAKYQPAKFRTSKVQRSVFHRGAVEYTLKAMYTNPMSKSCIQLQSHYDDSLNPILSLLGKVPFHQARQLIEILNTFNRFAFRMKPLLEKYPICAFRCDDNAVSFEWRMPDLILNLDIEEDPEETSWTLSSTAKAGLYSEGNYFPKDSQIDSVLSGILEKIVRHESVLI